MPRFLAYCNRFRCRCAKVLAYRDGLRCHCVAEYFIVLHKYHGGGKFLNQAFYLHPGIYVYKVKGLIPHIQVGALAKAFGKEHFLLLPTGKF